ncbi:hypothetical protein ALNOE001_01150 [Candidatus Methanobinarius endosymbioticus]|uniref:Right handed beta helix domain-containing protein n=1 Tax=Candidatus Methanobinarius endosymbioticus TaxID=2006182 RepID=A0A366MDY2_9EURY|nr:hypothetical protein ALNOE001_01150 [Candidatus Methanobinarius endosymbioticus]
MKCLKKNYTKILFICTIVLCLSQITTVSAVEFNPNSTLEEIQGFLNDQTANDTHSFAEGDYSFLSNLNITRSIDIIANGVVNIVGDGMSNVFNINTTGIVIKRLNIEKYNIAINSTKGNLIIENNIINNTKKEY